MSDYDAPCYTYRGVTIPGCWPVVLSGDDDDCTCPGSPNAIAMERRWRAWVRLEAMRERRRAREAEAEGLRALPGARPYRHAGPLVRVPLRLVHSRGDAS